MNILAQIANGIENSYWVSSNKDGTVYGTYLDKKSPYPNTDYPYQVIFRFYSPGATYVADTIQVKGGISLNGKINYGVGKLGTLINENTIVWSNGEIWSKVALPPVTTIDMYSNKYIKELNKVQTDEFYNRFQQYKSYNPYSI